jgi:ATP-dependent helicase/nuclease subunit B
MGAESARPAVFTIPLHLPFLDTLVAGLRAEIGDDPLALSRITIFLPTRRACRALREAFLRASEGRALLLPRMRPLGDLDDDELASARPTRRAKPAASISHLLCLNCGVGCC